jgi:hypothetical protein
VAATIVLVAPRTVGGSRRNLAILRSTKFGRAMRRRYDSGPTAVTHGRGRDLCTHDHSIAAADVVRYAAMAERSTP